jgi:hypothetical protein
VSIDDRRFLMGRRAAVTGEPSTSRLVLFENFGVEPERLISTR